MATGTLSLVDVCYNINFIDRLILNLTSQCIFEGNNCELDSCRWHRWCCSGWVDERQVWTETTNFSSGYFLPCWFNNYGYCPESMGDNRGQSYRGIGSWNGFHDSSSLHFRSLASQNQRCACKHKWYSHRGRPVSLVPYRSSIQQCKNIII